MLRFVFVLSAVFFLLLGVALYFLPASGLAGLAVTPLWVARVAGAVLLAWGAQLLVGAAQPSPAAVAGLVMGNALVAATLAPAALRGVAVVTGVPTVLWLVLSGALVLMAVLALILPRERKGF